MRSRGLLVVGLLGLVMFTSMVYADNGGYEVRPMTPEELAQYNSQPHEEIREVSFWELPLWVQLMYLSGTIASALVAIKLVPFALLKLAGTRDNRNREAIYRYVEENPGCTMNDIARSQSLNLGSVRYHVYRLELAHKIREIRTGKFARLFRNNGAYNEREIVVISALNIRTNKAIVSLLAADAGLSNKQIAERLRIKTSLAHVYLTDLVRDHIVRFERTDRQKTYFLESDVYGIIDKTCRRSPAPTANF